jgi:hypothetical protein
MSHNKNEESGSDILDSATDTDTHSTTVRHDWIQHDELSVTVVEAVTAATDRATTDLPPLQRAIDPDALDSLLSQGQSSSVTVSFEYAGADVWITANGTIQVQIDGEPSGRDGRRD